MKRGEVDLKLARQQMLLRQLHNRGIRDRRVLAAMDRVPRERFLDAASRDDAYSDRALAIDCGQTISQPYMVGLMTESLALDGSQRVLEVGTGSGYQTAILAQLAGEVVSIERHDELSRQAGAVLAELGCGNVTLVVGDGSLGWPPRAPYDRVLVTAAAARVPRSLLDQLADGGLLVIPLGPREHQLLQVIRKTGEGLQVRDLSACRFVPLVGAEGWPE